MQTNAKVLAVLAVVVMVGAGAVGLGYAYNASMTDTDNDIDTSYLKIDMLGDFYSDLDEGYLVYDTKTGWFYVSDGDTYKANDLCVDPVKIANELDGDPANELKRYYDDTTNHLVRYDIRTTVLDTSEAPDEFRHSVQLPLLAGSFVATHSEVERSYVAGWELISVTNSEKDYSPGFKLDITVAAEKLSVFDGENKKGGYKYYALVVPELEADKFVNTAWETTADAVGDKYLDATKVYTTGATPAYVSDKTKIAEFSADGQTGNMKATFSFDERAYTASSGNDVNRMLVVICVEPPADVFQAPEQIIMGTADDTQSGAAFEFKAYVEQSAPTP